MTALRWRGLRDGLWVIGLLIVLACAWASTGAASVARSNHPQRPVVLRPGFSRAGSASYVVAEASYVFIASIDFPGGTLINESNGRRATIHSGCQPIDIFGGPWFVVSANCPSPSESYVVELYNLSTGQTRSVAVSGHLCSDGATCSVQAGSDWLEVTDNPNCDGCRTQTIFQNLRTGQQGFAATDSKYVVDLSSPGLTSRICDPLQIPNGGTLTFYGQFAVADQPPATQVGFRNYLERCRSRLHQRLSDGLIFGNAQAILWPSPQVKPKEAQGLFLPTLKRFVIPLPAAVASSYTGFVLSAHSLYVTGRDSTLWRASAPAPTSR